MAGLPAHGHPVTGQLDGSTSIRLADLQTLGAEERGRHWGEAAIDTK